MRRALLLGAALLLVPASLALRVLAEPELARAATSDAVTVPYHGGPVLHASRVHLIFWQPAGAGLRFEPGYRTLVERFEADVAAASRSTGNVLGITGQFGDRRGPAVYAAAYAGAVLDAGPLPARGCSEPLLTGPPGWLDCVTDAQLVTELDRLVAADHLPTRRDDVYLLLTPRGLGDCTDSSSSSCALGGRESGYCGYHSATLTGTPYAVIPFNAVPGHCQSGNPRPNRSTADPALSTLAHEQAEIATDPFGNGWIDSQGDEIADVCISSYGPALGGSGDRRWDEVIHGDHFWLQELWSRVTGACEPRPQADQLAISAAWRGATAVLTGNTTVPGGRAVAYRWWFGDGKTGRGREARHRYGKRGRYRVTLRITDSFGNYATASRTLSVARSRATA